MGCVHVVRVTARRPLLQHTERTWEYVGRGPGDPTNNVTERVIGLTYKIRAKTMRGFKS